MLLPGPMSVFKEIFQCDSTKPQFSNPMEKWAEYFRLNNILFVFWSAKAASAALEGKNLSDPWMTQNTLQNMDNPDTKIYGRDELLTRLQCEAEEIAKMRRKSGSNGTGSSNVQSPRGNAVTSASKNVVVGFVGYPNVGKSSTINALVGQKRTGVTSTPGKTKHFQTLIMSDELTLCDCPGLVFPSFSSSRFEMIASGVLPIDRITENREAVQVVANRVPRHVIESVYKIKLPKPKPYESQSRPPLASELLRAYCASRGYVGSSGLPDETRATRQILKDYIDGKLPHYEMPPGMSNEESDLEDADEASSSEEHESDSSDIENPQDFQGENAPALEHVLEDLNSFDMANGLASKKASNKKPKAAHKQHKKPQRKKDRTWRVGNDDGDGMPVVRVYQKPVSTGSVKVG
ncbi:gtpase lsg1-2 [Quercus suber]|uniref:Gtpase lsg1-2 n=1 Tax=Quercus suber TaxID=58331 RepID=A0AAW0IQR4_QUESU